MRDVIELPGYRIGETLHAGTHFSVYRGVRLQDGAAMIVKVDDARRDNPQAGARLECEYALTRALDDPGVACAISLERAGRRHCSSSSRTPVAFRLRATSKAARCRSPRFS